MSQQAVFSNEQSEHMPLSVGARVPVNHRRIDGMVGSMAEPLTTALCVPGLNPARNKYLYGLQVVVPGQAVCVCDFSVYKRTHDIQVLFSYC